MAAHGTQQRLVGQHVRAPGPHGARAADDHGGRQHLPPAAHAQPQRLQEDHGRDLAVAHEHVGGQCGEHVGDEHGGSAVLGVGLDLQHQGVAGRTPRGAVLRGVVQGGVGGVGDRAEIWDTQAWNEYYAEQESSFSDIAEEVIPGLF